MKVCRIIHWTCKDSGGHCGLAQGMITSNEKTIRRFHFPFSEVLSTVELASWFVPLIIHSCSGRQDTQCGCGIVWVIKHRFPFIIRSYSIYVIYKYWHCEDVNTTWFSIVFQVTWCRMFTFSGWKQTPAIFSDAICFAFLLTYMFDDLDDVNGWTLVSPSINL